MLTFTTCHVFLFSEPNKRVVEEGGPGEEGVTEGDGGGMGEGG